jgi:hypothetical protein
LLDKRIDREHPSGRKAREIVSREGATMFLTLGLSLLLPWPKKKVERLEAEATRYHCRICGQEWFAADWTEVRKYCEGAATIAKMVPKE